MNYLSLAFNILLNPKLLRPAIFKENVSKIDLKILKESFDINVLVFDKDNTLTSHLGLEYFDIIYENKINEAKHIFGSENVVIVSNSIRKSDFEKVFNNKLDRNYRKES